MRLDTKGALTASCEPERNVRLKDSNTVSSSAAVSVQRISDQRQADVVAVVRNPQLVRTPQLARNPN